MNDRSWRATPNPDDSAAWDPRSESSVHELEAAHLQYDAGRSHLAAGDYAAAVEQFELSLLTAPNHAPTHYLASRAYFELREFVSALMHANLALHHNPNNQGAYLQKIRSLAALQRW